MKYVKYIITTKDGRKVELARSYKNKQRFPKCPHRWRIDMCGAITVETDFCDQKEKAKIYRRGDHAQYEGLINAIEKMADGVRCD